MKKISYNDLEIKEKYGPDAIQLKTGEIEVELGEINKYQYDRVPLNEFFSIIQNRSKTLKNVYVGFDWMNGIVYLRGWPNEVNNENT